MSDHLTFLRRVDSSPSTAAPQSYARLFQLKDISSSFKNELLIYAQFLSLFFLTFFLVCVFAVIFYGAIGCA